MSNCILGQVHTIVTRFVVPRFGLSIRDSKGKYKCFIQTSLENETFKNLPGKTGSDFFYVNLFDG